MPRAKIIRKDLSEGWNKLYREWRLPLKAKIANSHRFLCKIFTKHTSPVVCWSGGKDSGTVLHLALQHNPKVPVVFVETGVDFPETKQFVRQTAKKLKLNLTIAGLNGEDDFWVLGKRYGWPIFGKNIASNVERAKRTGNIRAQLSVLEKSLVGAGVNISMKCAEYLQERPSKLAELRLNADAKIIGLRAQESRARVRLWVDHGEYYFVKRYYGRGKGIWKVNPIATWTEEDIWEYHRINKIPICKLYRMGYPRNGCWPCAMAARNGQLKRLRENHPALFYKLIQDTPMGKELMKAKLFMLKKKIPKRITQNYVKQYLKKHPNAFDSF